MANEQWVTAALTNDAIVAELLLRMKQSSSLDSLQALPPPTTATALLPPIGWGHRKSRSKPSTTTTSAAAASGFRKEQQGGSPTTPLCWSGGCGGGASTSDGFDESSHPSDLSSGGRSTKGALGNEGATTSTYQKSRKRKSFAELKEEEDFLLKERVHLNRELESMRVTMNKQIAASQNLKKLKIDLHQNPKKETETMTKIRDHESKNRMQGPTTGNHLVQASCGVKAETETRERGFVLPDLNMTPIEEEL